MNDDDFWQKLLQPTLTNNWDYTYQQAKLMEGRLTSQEIYDLLIKLDTYNKKDTKMAYTSSRYDTTRGDDVATAVLEAYANGIPFETLIKKNGIVRQYWYQIQHEKAHAEQLRQAHQERQRKLAEKRAIEQAKREEAMQKLTPEELEAFGFMKNKKKVTKR